VIKFREDLLDKSVDELYDWLKLNNYEYIIISGSSYTSLAVNFGETRTKEVLDTLPAEMSQSNKFQVTYQNKGAVIFKVV
jgi:hypothetical protein